MYKLRHQLASSASYMRGNMLVFTLTGMLGAFGRAMAFPYASLYVLALGGEPAQIGWVNSLGVLAGLVAFPLAGYLTDRTNRVKLFALTGILTGSIYALYVVAPSWHWLAIATLIRGFGVLQFPPSSALIADSLAPCDRGKGIATMNMLSGLPSFVAPLVAGWCLKSWGTEMGMRALYAYLLVSYVGGSLISLRFLHDPRAATERIGARDLVRVLRNAYAEVLHVARSLPQSLRALGAVIGLGFIINAIAGPFWVVYAVEYLGLETTQWGTILLVEMLLLYALSVPAGLVVDRIGRRVCMLGALGLIVAGLVGFLFAGGFVSALLVRSSIALAGAFFSPACTALMADSIPKEERGRTMALLGRGSILIGSGSGGTGGPGLGLAMIPPVFIASLVAGGIYALDPRLPWVLGTVAAGLAMLLLLGWVREPARAEA